MKNAVSPISDRIGVVHLVDTLERGGMERVAVNLVNALPRARYQLHLCTTRRDGALAGAISKDVGRLRLNRRRRFDIGAVRRLVDYIRERNIRLLHAHGSALFIARAAAWFARDAAVIWHDHYGAYLEDDRPVWLYRPATHGIGGVIAVNGPLADWARDRLQVDGEKVWYIPNFVCPKIGGTAPPMLPGTAGGRIVCVANLRPQKDHLNLVRAMQVVKSAIPYAHLILVGVAGDQYHLKRVMDEIKNLGLSDSITWLGERDDVAAILRSCDMAVLGSASEGLPLALIEYGMEGLPVVATQVGQCAEVLDAGRAGRLVPPGAPDQLAEAIISLLRDRGRAAELGARLRAHVQANYGAGANIERVCRVYEATLDRGYHPAPHTNGRVGLAG